MRLSSRSKTVSPHLSEHVEDYLERIYELTERLGYARVTDIAKELHLTPSTVSNTVKRLGKLGYLDYEKYRGFKLTKKGVSVAQDIRSRHEILTHFLKLLGLPDDIVNRDVEGIEHHLSKSTLDAISKLCKQLQSKSKPLK
jgi:Mn-dependent DtxR family transcriptional regulator